MSSSQPITVRDPVCGMAVHPDTAKYRLEHLGKTWYFCAQNCQAQFAADPERFLPKVAPAVVRQRPALGREAAMAGLVFVAVAALLIMARGIAKKPATEVQAVVTGSAAGQHEAVDDGAGGVIVSANHDQSACADGQAVFMVSLNTHTIDLTNFDPAKQVQLHAGSTVETPVAVSVGGDNSSHHQNYQVTFRKPTNNQVMLSMHNVSGVGERELPFKL